MRYIWICLAISIATALHASEPSKSINDFIEAEMQISKAPGLAYAVVQDGEVFSRSYGEILLGSGRPLTFDTPFVIGSISKSFTAMAIMKLVETGKVDLDTEVSQYLKAFKGQPSGIITVRQLLSHTSGYSTKQGNDIQIDERQSKDALQRQVKRIAQWSPPYAPDANWQYSNANYLILGALIEDVSGQDFATHIKAEILEPIGMKQSFVADGKRHDKMAIGHQPWFGTKRPLKDNITGRVTAPAGGIISNASDMGLYLSIMLNGKDDVITAESKALMMQPASAASPFYGLGWYIDAENDTVNHAGLTPGVETFAILSQEEKKGVIVLINSNSGMGFGVNTALFNGISSKALGLDFKNNGNDWGTKSLFLMFLFTPILFFVGILQLGFRRDGLLAKSGVSGALSLWFPLLMTLVLAWVCVQLIPGLFGVSIKTLSLYQPDFVIALIATAVTGLIWATLRLGVFYGGRSQFKKTV